MMRMIEASRHDAFEKDLTQLINKYSLENCCDTPDFVIASMLVGFFDAYCANISRRDKWFGFDPFNRCEGCENCKEPETDEPQNKHPGFIVWKHGEGMSHTVFVEWRGGTPVYADNANMAMIFECKAMARHICEKLGDGWDVLDLAELREESGALERLYKAIFGEEEETGEPDAEGGANG